MSSARGQHYFFMVKILLENAGNLTEDLAKTFFVFLLWRSPEKKIWRPFLFFFEIVCKIFLKTFLLFVWRTLAPVSLVLVLVSSIPVLGLERVCPRPRIFLCPWPWPQASCPRLHFWPPVIKIIPTKRDVFFSFFKHFRVQQYTCTTDYN